MKKNHLGVSFRYIKEFSCLGDKCENTCCKGWNIYLSQDELVKYERLDPNVYNYLLENKNEKGYAMLKHNSNFCNFYSKGLCALQVKHGIKGLPKTCSTYPRWNRYFNNQFIESATISCPEILRNCLKKNAFDFQNKIFDESPILISMKIIKSFDSYSYLELINIIIQEVLKSNYNLTTSINYIAHISKIMSEKPLIEWKDSIKSIQLHNETPTTNYDTGLKRDQSLLFLIIQEILSSNNIQLENIRITLNNERYLKSSSNNEKKYHFKSKIITSYFHNNRIDNILKKLIAYDISLLCLPINHLSSGKEIGKESALHWGHFIILNALIRRIILLAHTNTEGVLPDTDSIVDIIHRFSRSTQHIKHSTTEESFIRTSRVKFNKSIFPLV